MLGIFKRLLSDPPAPEFTAPLVIDRPTYAFGDVHGRYDLLAPLVRSVLQDAAEAGHDRPRLVFMGDYVDRGEGSKEVIDFLLSLMREVGADPGSVEGDVVLLRGNHEDMMLNFLADPENEGTRWLRNGGLQTLLSYGVGGVTSASPPETLKDAAVRLHAALADHVDALEKLPAQARFGDVFFAHAGADPEVHIGMQAQRALIWGASSMLHAPRTDGIWVVHGHYVVDEPDARLGRIALDTGAYFSGRLTAARLWDGEVEFIQVEE